MEWVEEFYSLTDVWWGAAESSVDDQDRERARFLAEVAPDSVDVLELGCGYGSTAIAIAETGRTVVGVDLSDRIERATDTAPQRGSTRFVRADFFTFDPHDRFDVVCYWDGFGVGDDRDQLRLLRRIRDDWLRPNGVVILDVFHPSGWRADDGLDEITEPASGDGYVHRLHHRRRFDHSASRAIDSWSEVASSSGVEQSLRCYEATEVTALAADAGLVAEVADPEEPCWAYRAVLRPEVP